MNDEKVRAVVQPGSVRIFRESRALCEVPANGDMCGRGGHRLLTSGDMQVARVLREALGIFYEAGLFPEDLLEKGARAEQDYRRAAVLVDMAKAACHDARIAVQAGDVAEAVEILRKVSEDLCPSYCNADGTAVPQPKE